MENAIGNDGMTVEEVRHLPAVVDAATAARLLGFSRHYVGDLLARGEIQGVKLGGRWRVNTGALLRRLGIAEEVSA